MTLSNTKELSKSEFAIPSQFHQLSQEGWTTYAEAGGGRTALRGAASTASGDFSRLSAEQQAARRALHEEEVRARLGWCLERGLTPAAEHVHRAPGDDANFMFGVPPWLPDGSVNPRGVPFGRPEDLRLAKERQLEDYSAAGWACRRCGAAVRAVPREFRGAAEPLDWWWCTACKLAHAAKHAPKTAKQKKLAQAAEGCRRLDAAWAAR